MRPNKIKQMWRDGKCSTLGWLSISHGFTAEIMARQGFDALCIDLQHAIFMLGRRLSPRNCQRLSSERFHRKVLEINRAPFF